MYELGYQPAVQSLAQPISRLLWLLAIVGIVLSSACSSCRRSAAAPYAIPSLIPFRHLVIDANPLSGMDCCTDVLAVGDVSGDGHPDVVIGAQNSSGAGLVWYQNPEWTRREVARGEFTTDGKVADLDADGDQDIVVGELTKGLTWFENLGSGRDWAPHIIGAGYVHDIEIGDVDADGKADILTCDKNELVLWRQRISGWAREPLLASKGEGIALADLDRDQDLDVIFGPIWLENDGTGTRWDRHSISSNWSVDTRARVGDMNADGSPDVILTASEGSGRVSWFSVIDNPRGSWREHRVHDVELVGAHSLAVADLDGDRDMDLAVAEMHTSESKRVLVFVNDGNDAWRVQILSVSGSHNMQAADFDGDGDVELVGKNYAGAGRAVEYWDNLTRENFGTLVPTAAPFLGTGWRYAAIDDRRDDDQKGKMGLVAADVNRDGRLDIVGGSFLYLNPGTDLSKPWRRVRAGSDVDVIFAADVDGDRYGDLIAVRGTSLLWLEATDEGASAWVERVVANNLQDGRTQGYIAAQLEPGGREELAFTRSTTLSYVRIPDDPESGEWPIVVVSPDAEEEGVAAADIDRDGDVDLVATQKGGQSAAWFENPATPGAKWIVHRIGGRDEGERWLDRVLTADVNQDGLVDVLISEESQQWTYDSSIFWFEAPRDPRNGRWTRHGVAVLRSINSLDIHDFDADGDLDIVAAEHTDMRDSVGASNNLTVIFENALRGAEWRAHPVEAGPHSSHLGARAFNLSGRGMPEIVSLGWNQFRQLHLWFRE